MQGKFIAIEGLDGCGSTTQIRLLGERLSNVHLTAEPSDGPIGRLIRQALREEVNLSDGVLPYLFAADRKDHLESEIEPALAEGKIVITDRYYGSSLAYQSLIAPLDQVLSLNQQFRAPDAVVFMDISPEHALERIEKRGEAKERFETLAKLQEIARSFAIAMALLSDRGERILRVDAVGSQEEVHTRIRNALKECLL